MTLAQKQVCSSMTVAGYIGHVSRRLLARA